MPSQRSLRILSLTVATLSLREFTAAESRRLTYEDMLAHLTDLTLLPEIEPGVTCRQFSSYDRASTYDAGTDTYLHWDANGDHGQYLRIDEQTGEGVMAEMNKPGCVFRIWSANPQGMIRFYLDGDTDPTFEWDFHKLCTGEIEPFIRPLVYKRDPQRFNSASNIYLPIPYAKSCRITAIDPARSGANRAPDQYYIIDYREFPEDWTIEPFSLPLTSSQKDAVEQTARKWENSGTLDHHPLNRFVTEKAILEPGESKTLATLDGPSVIHQFRMKLNSMERWAGRKVQIKVFWDDDKEPGILAPFADFFGDPELSPYKSYPMGITESFNYCHFPMPFRRSARVVVENDGHEPAEVDVVLVHRPQEIPENWAYFHAKWRIEINSRSFDYPLLDVKNTAGKLVGICLFPYNHHGGWWGEGDEKVYVDGEKFPSWFGTGSEDYFGDAWGIRTMHNPSHGFPQPQDGSGAKNLFANYRWHLGDSIPFTTSFRMTIENYAGLPQEDVHNDYSSMAYWYALPGGKDFFEPTPVWDRIPREHSAPGAVEAENALSSGDLGVGMDIVDNTGLPRPLSGNRGVKLTGKVGDTFTLKFPVDKEEFYRVEILTAHVEKASVFEAEINGRGTDELVHLVQGTNPVTIRFTGRPVEGDRCEVIIDSFVPRVDRRLITEWMAIGPFANPDMKGLDIACPPENELDMSKTYDGRDGKPVGWQKVSNPSGKVTLNHLFNPSTDCVAYGTCIVNAKTAGTYKLLLGSDDGVKVWINGEQVWRNRLRRGILIDEDQADVTLQEGRNTVLIKIDQGPGDLGWAVRVRDPDRSLAYALPE
jgi:hypothetical protein